MFIEISEVIGSDGGNGISSTDRVALTVSFVAQASVLSTKITALQSWTQLLSAMLGAVSGILAVYKAVFPHTAKLMCVLPMTASVTPRCLRRVAVLQWMLLKALCKACPEDTDY
jgi:hypothetical protein